MYLYFTEKNTFLKGGGGEGGGGGVRFPHSTL